MRKIRTILAALLPLLFTAACLTPNERFQKVWYDAVRTPYQARRARAQSIADLAGEFLAQLDLADRYGGARVVYLGDSNAEYAARRRTMERFERVAVNIGVGGTATDDWCAFFRSDRGRPVLQRLQASGALVLISLGGNDVLQSRLTRTAANYATLRAWFPRSMVVLVPPIHVEGLYRATGKSREQVRREIAAVNRTAATVFVSDVIDTSAALRAPGGGEAFAGALRDPIHLSDLAYDLIIDTVNAVLKND